MAHGHDPRVHRASACHWSGRTGREGHFPGLGSGEPHRRRSLCRLESRLSSNFLHQVLVRLEQWQGSAVVKIEAKKGKCVFSWALLMVWFFKTNIINRLYVLCGLYILNIACNVGF